MRVIFLDVDGVLNSPDYQVHRHTRGKPPIDPVCVAYLNELTAQTSARIVVSSTWRRAGLVRIRRTLREAGVLGPIVGITPVLEHRYVGPPAWLDPGRGAEICRWLAETRYAVESFVILDDDADMGALLDRLVRTDYQTGLTLIDVERARKLLALPHPSSRATIAAARPPAQNATSTCLSWAGTRRHQRP